MPSLRKHSSVESTSRPTSNMRAQIANEYSSYLSDFTIGDYGRVDLANGEQRAVVRRRLQTAAGQRGLVLRFRPGPGPALIFYVEAAPVPASQPTPASQPASADRPAPVSQAAPASQPASADQPAPANRPAPTGRPARARRPAAQMTRQSDEAPPQPPQPAAPRPRQNSAERYRSVLPRWMREGQPRGRSGGNKRGPR